MVSYLPVIFIMLAILTAMVGNRVIRIALRTSIMAASIGVATIGNPSPRVPWIRPANSITPNIAITTSTSKWSNEIIGGQDLGKKVVEFYSSRRMITNMVIQTNLYFL
jgi:hypothetical protein